MKCRVRVVARAELVRAVDRQPMVGRFLLDTRR